MDVLKMDPVQRNRACVCSAAGMRDAMLMLSVLCGVNSGAMTNAPHRRAAGDGWTHRLKTPINYNL